MFCCFVRGGRWKLVTHDSLKMKDAISLNKLSCVHMHVCYSRVRLLYSIELCVHHLVRSQINIRATTLYAKCPIADWYTTTPPWELQDCYPETARRTFRCLFIVSTNWIRAFQFKRTSRNVSCSLMIRFNQFQSSSFESSDVLCAVLFGGVLR